MNINYVLTCGCPYAAIAPRPLGGWVTCFPHGEVTVLARVLGSGAVCADGAGCKKPHLRLHYKPLHNGKPSEFNWWVEYMRGPSPRARRETYPHNKAWGALMSAASLWF